MPITRRFTVYTNAGVSVPPVIHVNQYDRGETWIFTLLEPNGSQYIPASGGIVGIKADGHAIINTATVNSNGEVVVSETQQMTAAPGKAVYEIIFDNSTHGTANFIVCVEPKPGDNATLSDSDLSLIQEAIDSTIPANIEASVQDWMDDNLAPAEWVIDNTLSIAGAAADAKKVGDVTTELKTALTEYNCTNEFAFVDGKHTGNSTVNGITITKASDDSYSVSGTATEATPVQFYVNDYGFPDFLPKGVEKYLYWERNFPNTVSMRINTYAGGSESSFFADVPSDEFAPITIPNDATGVSIYLRIPSGTTVNGTCKLIINDGKKSNLQLTEEVGTLTEEVGTLTEEVGTLTDITNLTTETIPLPVDVIFTNTGLIKASDGTIVAYADAKYSDPIKVYKGDVINYALGTNGTAYCLIAECKEDGTFVSSVAVGEPGVVTSGTYTVTKDTYMRFCGRNVWIDTESVFIIRNKRINQEVEAVYDNSWENLYASIYKVGIVGDSYSACRLYGYNSGGNLVRIDDTDGNNDVPFYSWGRYLQRWSGMVYKIFATGGLECKTWLSCSAPESSDAWGTKGFGWNYANRAENYCQAYVMCLGINDASRHEISYVGTEADINDSDGEQNADTFIGNYAKIIQRIKGIVPQAKFFCVTMPTYTAENNREKYTAFNRGIRTVANHFDNCYLIDLYADYYDMYNNANGYFKNSLINGHLTAPAYARVAKVISKAISRIMFENPSDFETIEYTDYTLWGETQEW